MKKLATSVLAALAIMVLVCGSALAQSMTAEEAERQGIDLPMTAAFSSQAVKPGEGNPSLQTFLLIPESTNDRIMQFDATTGDLINADFIPADPDNLSTPIQAILSAGGDSILVSDQLDDVVQEYDLQGNYLGVFAPAGGVNNAILDNIRGIALLPNGNLLVTVGGGSNDDAIAMFDSSGNSLGNLVANGAGGLDSPFDVLQHPDLVAEGITLGDLIVGGINSDTIHTFDSSDGSHGGDIGPIDTFPEQIAPVGVPTEGTGDILIANFSGTQEGIVEMTFGGTVIGVYDPPSLGGYRGVYDLPNGNLLVTNGNGVHEIDRAGNLVESKITGVSGRFITEVTALVPVELQSFSVE